MLRQHISEEVRRRWIARGARRGNLRAVRRSLPAAGTCNRPFCLHRQVSDSVTETPAVFLDLLRGMAVYRTCPLARVARIRILRQSAHACEDVERVTSSEGSHVGASGSSELLHAVHDRSYLVYPAAEESRLPLEESATSSPR